MKFRLRPCSDERYAYYLDGLKVNGKRKRRFFKTKREGELELERLSIIQRRQGQAGLNLSESVRGMAVECTDLLSPFGKTILDAARFYAEHLSAISQSVSVENLSTDYLQSKVQAKFTVRHLADIKQRIGRFRADFGQRAVRTLTPKELTNWLHALELAPQTVNNHRKILHAMFGYAVDHGLVDKNPLDAVGTVKLVGAPPAIFTPEDLATLLHTSSDELLPCLVIGAFAGLRTAELHRLGWTK